MEAVVYLRDRLVARSEARVSPFDYGFTYGFGLFETMRACSGRVFRLRQHLDRLFASAPLVSISLPWTRDELEKAVYLTIRGNGLTGCRVRLAVTAGEGATTPDLQSCKSPTLLIAAMPVSSGGKDVMTATVSEYRRNSLSPLCRVKSTNYMESLLARDSAKRKGFDEAILLNEKGQVAEGTTSNVFLITGGALVTPDEGSGLLPGVTRAAVLEIAGKLGLRVEIRRVSLEELMSCSEAFLTNSVVGIEPLVRVDGSCLGNGRLGPVTGKLMSEYSALVARETCGQAVI